MTNQGEPIVKVDELDRLRADLDEARDRLAEIGAYAADQVARRSSVSIAGQAFQRIARLARA
jgi:hypothetical protein